MSVNQTIINEDCLYALKHIYTDTVDLVLTDPPYNLARNSNFKTMGRAGLDFGDWDKNADILSYIKEIPRILKRNGSFVTFSAWENLGDIKREAEKHGLIAKEMITFEKTNPMPRNRDRRYVTDYECAIWFVKPNGKWTFNRQEKTYQRPRFKCSIDKGLHSTQKPLKLMEEIIKIHSNPGDMILDCFAGSGTTALAAKNLNRSFIAIELDKDYFNTMKERLNLNK